MPHPRRAATRPRAQASPTLCRTLRPARKQSARGRRPASSSPHPGEAARAPIFFKQLPGASRTRGNEEGAHVSIEFATPSRINLKGPPEGAYLKMVSASIILSYSFDASVASMYMRAKLAQDYRRQFFTHAQIHIFPQASSRGRPRRAPARGRARGVQVDGFPRDFGVERQHVLHRALKVGGGVVAAADEAAVLRRVVGGRANVLRGPSAGEGGGGKGVESIWGG